MDDGNHESISIITELINVILQVYQIAVHLILN